MEYKVIIYREGFLGSLLLGASKIDPVRFSEFLNGNAKEGWKVITMSREERRLFLFFKREAHCVIMGREV